MRRLIATLLAVTATVLPVMTSHAETIAGVFDWPFAPSGSYNRTSGQYFMQWNPDFQKYHLADDWNGSGGGSADLGLPLYALADGIVQYKDDRAIRHSIGKVLIVRYTLPDGSQVDSVYEHMQKILVGGPPTPVVKGQQIATIGDANGYYLNQAHLHWELRRDLSLTANNPEANPYVNPLTIQTALKYTSPSLFVDDRHYPFSNTLTYRAWTYISWHFNAPSSTTYVQYNGQRYSLKRAIASGLIYQYVYEQRAGQWYYYPNVADVFFSNGNTYAIYANVQGATVNIFVPGDHYRADRARQDMIKAANRDSRFANIKTETYGENLGWGSDWELRYMAFGYTSSSGSGTTYFNQATFKSNPLLRYTSFYDPDRNQWTAWAQVNMNTLD
jgi:peptidase M23-like protein